MAETDKTKASITEKDAFPSSTGPLVFVSHDGRDAELAEAFSKLLRSVSAGMLKTFRSSDKKGTEGIDFGDEWYKRIMFNLQTTSHVVCLFTERSLDRPWILFEAGVAKAKLTTPVLGIAMGVPLNRVSTGPFYQFQNCDDSESDLTKLVHQLAKGIPNLELDADVVKSQVATFKATEDELLKKLTSRDGKRDKDAPEDNPIAKLAEEMKALPSRVAELLTDTREDPNRRRKMRRIHPMMIEDIIHMAGPSYDQVAILLVASSFKDDAPWLYELAMDVYRAAKSGDPLLIKAEMARLQQFAELTMRGPFMEELGFRDKETYMLCMELPNMLERILERTLRKVKAGIPRPRNRIVEQHEPGT